MIKLKDLLAEAVEIENNIPFSIHGIKKNDIIIQGRKIKITLSFKGDDLKNAIEGRSKKGKVVQAIVSIK
tara:strand:+ start:38 stop:247 length:210 start_codon:yes stop_codon:yes gene_type:complete